MSAGPSANAWWRNLKDGGQVEVRIRGTRRAGRAFATGDDRTGGDGRDPAGLRRRSAGRLRISPALVAARTSAPSRRRTCLARTGGKTLPATVPSAAPVLATGETQGGPEADGEPCVCVSAGIALLAARGCLCPGAEVSGVVIAVPGMPLIRESGRLDGCLVAVSATSGCCSPWSAARGEMPPSAGPLVGRVQGGASDANSSYAVASSSSCRSSCAASSIALCRHSAAR